MIGWRALRTKQASIDDGAHALRPLITKGYNNVMVWTCKACHRVSCMRVCLGLWVAGEVAVGGCIFHAAILFPCGSLLTHYASRLTLYASILLLYALLLASMYFTPPGSTP